MPIRIKTDLEFGDIFYLKTDPDQFEHELVGVLFLPGNAIKFLLEYGGDTIQVYDFQCSKERDPNKASDAEDED